MIDNNDLFNDDAEMTEAEEEAWCEAERSKVIEYLAGQSRLSGLQHGEVGEWPAWFLPPYISIWAVESLKSPGWVGWWAISTPLLCDYCSAEQPAHPRKAARHFSRIWRQAARAREPGGERFEDLGLPEEIGPLLEETANRLEALVKDDEAWPR